jgi:multimeric flavodoxin WrbA
MTTTPDPHPKVLGIGGSPRKRGNSDVLMDHLLKGVENQKIDTEKAHLRDYQFSSCIGCERCRKDKICTGLNDGMTLLYPPVRESRGLILVSPTHTYNITALMKAFIDRLYCFFDFADTRPRDWESRLAGQGRKAVIAAICEQESKENMGMTLEAMRLPLAAFGYEIVEEIAVFRLFDRGAIKQETAELEKAVRTGEKLAQALQKAV